VCNLHAHLLLPFDRAVEFGTVTYDRDGKVIAWSTGSLSAQDRVPGVMSRTTLTVSASDV